MSEEERCDIIAAQPSRTDAGAMHPKTEAERAAVLEVVSLTKRYADQPAIADIDLAVADDRIGLEAGVQTGMEPKRQGDGLGHKVTQRNLDPIGGKLLVELFPGRYEPVDAGIDRQMDLGSGLFGLEHPAGDGLPHSRMGYSLAGRSDGRWP